MSDVERWLEIVAATEAALAALTAGDLSTPELQEMVSRRATAIAELTETDPDPELRPVIGRLVDMDRQILALCASRLAELATARGRVPRPTEEPRVVSDVA